jgi:hypothetical protein
MALLKAKSLSRLLLLCLVGLGAFGARASQKLPPHPTMISLLHYTGSEIQGEQFGHIDLRFSYGPELSSNDRVVGFGPSKDVAKGALAYLGLGDHYPMIHWNDSFAARYEEGAKQRMVRVTNLVLKLDASERNHVAALMNEIFKNGHEAPYNLLVRNCATTVVNIVHAAAGLPKGVLTFMPGSLKRKWAGFSERQVVYPSGRDLKKEILHEDAGYEALFDDEVSRKIFEKQLASMRTENRVLAYRTLERKGAWALKSKLMNLTETAARREAIEQALDAGPVSSLTVLRLSSGEKFRSAEVVGDELVVVSDKSLFVNQQGPRRQAPASIPNRLTTSLARLGLPEGGQLRWTVGVQVERGSRDTVYVWLTPDLGVDAH